MPGSIQKRGEETYRLLVSCGSDYRGKRITYTKTIHTNSEAKAKKELARFYAECQDGKVDVPSDNITLSNLCEYWLTNYAEVTLKPSTVRGYKVIIKNQISKLGDIKIGKLKTTHIQEWINDIYKDGASAKYCKNVYSLLNNIIEKAVKWHIMSSNPCRNVDIPRQTKKEAEHYTESEVKLLLSRLKTADYTEEKIIIGIFIGLMCGLRLGETLGLRWTNINWVDKCLTIDHTRMYVSGKGVITETPKTMTSIRTICFPQIVYDELLRWKYIQEQYSHKLGELYKDTDYIITGDLGDPIHPSVFTKGYRKFFDDHNLRYISYHKLRHTHASMLSGIATPKEISTRLGHAQVSTTMNIYSHIFQETDKGLADNLDKTVTKLLPFDN